MGPRILTSFPVPAQEKHPPTTLHCGDCSLTMMSVFLDGQKVLVTSVQIISFHMFGDSTRPLPANSLWSVRLNMACCGALQLLQGDL